MSLAWQALPRAARLYVAAVIAVGASLLVLSVPPTWPRPGLFVFLLVVACFTSAWKVNLPIALASGATLSVSYAADLTALLLLGPRHAMLIAVAGAWTQCRFHVKQRYPLYRTAFSLAAEAMTMIATGAVYVWLDGPTRPIDVSLLAKPLVGAIATYFVVNTGLVAGAIALSTGRRFPDVWRQDFLWSGASFVVAGTAGALAAIVIDRGEYWKATLMLAPVYLTYRTYLLFMGRIEDQKRHVTEMRRLHEEAVEANRLKDQFLAMVSHELRTPLNAILGWSDMLRTGKLDEARRDRASQAIYGSARRQAQLIDELLDVARIISGKLTLDRAAVDLRAVVRGALEVVQSAADAKRIRVALDVPRQLGAVDGDPARLQQIAWNLLSNAVKFTPEGGTVHLRLRRAEGFAEMVVTDSGEGISREFLPSVFEPFRQADGSTTRRHGGLGLGLSIVRHLVEAHGGTVRADSGGEGRGATFTVRLPFAVGEPRRPAPADFPTHGEVLSPPTSLEGLAVLVVDDDEETRQVVAAHLESRRAVVLTAASAAQALEVLERERVDVLLADVAMPGEDGYTLIRRLRARGASALASIPAAALTAFAREEDRQQALEAGFQLHLPKPIDARTLVAAIASLARPTAT